MATENSSATKLNPTEVRKISNTIAEMRKEMGRVFFGHENVVDSLIRSILCDGHTLLEGVPGIAKTLAIKALAAVSGCSSRRIQFTVDLLPTDITGLTIYDPKKGFEIVKGPIFSNFVIADEINRSPPKTQSALIESMQEKQVTIGKETLKLPSPFFVMATQNPLEQEGVYILPEAQIDRFLYKVIFSYPTQENEQRVMEENMTFRKFEEMKIKPIVSDTKIIEMQKVVHRIYLDRKIKDYIMFIVDKSRRKDFRYGEFIEVGASPRASINLFISAKASALLSGRNYVIPEDVDKVAHDVLRHRIILSYRAQSEGIDSTKIIEEILKIASVP